jgi:hypothetical protein
MRGRGQIKLGRRSISFAHDSQGIVGGLADRPCRASSSS